MRTRIISDEISGKPVEVVDPLMPEHIEVGRLLWYRGFTSVGRWDCPAVIIRVGKNKCFNIRSLDDMRDQTQLYGADPERDRSGSRQTMRVATVEEVAQYLDEQRESLQSAVDSARENLVRAEKDLARFDEVRTTLKLV